jgi:hypothetical protein
VQALRVQLLQRLCSSDAAHKHSYIVVFPDNVLVETNADVAALKSGAKLELHFKSD